jgi:hypothetical protein
MISSMYTPRDPIIKNIQAPNILVYDKDGRLPLNLQRTAPARSKFSFLPDLVSDVVDDLIAYALVSEMGDAASNNDTYGWLRGKYEGFQHPDRVRLHRWFVAKSGFGFVDKDLIQRAHPLAVAVAYTMDGNSKTSERRECLQAIRQSLPNEVRLMFLDGLEFTRINDRKLLARSLFRSEWEAVSASLGALETNGHRVFLQKAFFLQLRG